MQFSLSLWQSTGTNFKPTTLLEELLCLKKEEVF